MPLLRVLARLVGLLLLVILALAGATSAVFSIQGGTGALSAANLAHLLHLPAARDAVGAFLHDLESHAPSVAAAPIFGAAAILLGLGLLLGALIPRRQRLLIIDTANDGTLGLRRRAAAQAVRSLAEQAREIDRARARIWPRRAGTGGRARVTLYRAHTGDGAAAVLDAAIGRLEPLSDELSLRVRTRSRIARNGGRVR